jgi:hypothetical protein
MRSGNLYNRQMRGDNSGNVDNDSRFSSPGGRRYDSESQRKETDSKRDSENCRSDSKETQDVGPRAGRSDVTTNKDVRGDANAVHEAEEVEEELRSTLEKWLKRHEDHDHNYDQDEKQDGRDSRRDRGKDGGQKTTPEAAPKSRRAAESADEVEEEADLHLKYYSTLTTGTGTIVDEEEIEKIKQSRTGGYSELDTDSVVDGDVAGLQCLLAQELIEAEDESR